MSSPNSSHLSKAGFCPQRKGLPGDLWRRDAAEGVGTELTPPAGRAAGAPGSPLFRAAHVLPAQARGLEQANKPALRLSLLRPPSSNHLVSAHNFESAPEIHTAVP